MAIEKKSYVFYGKFIIDANLVN